MAYRTNNDILNAIFGEGYDLILRAKYHVPEEKDFRIKMIVLETAEVLQKKTFKIDLSFIGRFINKLIDAIPVRQRLNITEFGPITMATR